MLRKGGKHPAAPPRIRGGALVTRVVGGIGMAATVVGAVQYWLHGRVDIRPGHPPVTDRAEAFEMLIVLGVVSTAFVAAGLLLRGRARRLSRALRNQRR